MFKFVIVLACVAAIAAQHQLGGHSDHHDHHDHHEHHDNSDYHGSSEDVHAVVKELYQDVNEHGFKYGYQLSNHINAAAEGDEHGNHHGNFQWIAPKGQHINVEYTADEYGYHPHVSFDHK